MLISSYLEPMTKKDELRFRVQRFLAGPFNVTDLSTTFLFLRGQSFGRNTVRDIGDMLGHADLRDRGLSVDRVRNLQVIALYKMRAFIGEKSSELDLSDAPPTLLAVMDATLALLDDSILLHHTGMSRGQVVAALAKIKRKFSVKENGKLFWDCWKITDKQLSTIKCLTSFIISKPAYAADDLVEDTLYLLLKHRLMDEHQVDLFYTKRDYLLLFAIVSMHGVTFDCPQGVPAEAKAGWGTVDDVPSLNVCVEFPIQDEPELKIALALFDTQLNPTLWSEDWIDGRPHIVFDRPIEISVEGRLRCMT